MKWYDRISLKSAQMESDAPLPFFSSLLDPEDLRLLLYVPYKDWCFSCGTNVGSHTLASSSWIALWKSVPFNSSQRLTKVLFPPQTFWLHLGFLKNSFTGNWFFCCLVSSYLVASFQCEANKYIFSLKLFNWVGKLWRNIRNIIMWNGLVGKHLTHLPHFCGRVIFQSPWGLFFGQLESRKRKNDSHGWKKVHCVPA